MGRISRAAAAAVAVLLCLSGLAAPARAVNDEPIQQKWAPSEWGPDDKAGAVNRTTPAHVLRAVKLVKRGKVATLGKPYAADGPTFGVRGWKLIIPGLPTGGPFGKQELVYNDEFVAAELGQVGTQFDGPGHIGVRTSQGLFFYNGRYLDKDKDISTYGLGPLGVEHVAKIGFVCRGVLLDAVALRGGRLPIPKTIGRTDPGIVTDADVQEMVRRQGLAPIGEGDCVFLHTGHGDLWDAARWDSFSAEEKARRIQEFNAGAPGFGISACEYLAAQKIILTGSDQWATDAVGPNAGGETEQPFECHIKLQTKRGIWNLENLDFSQLIADRAYEFLFVWSPLKMKGATGSPGNPIALY